MGDWEITVLSTTSFSDPNTCEPNVVGIGNSDSFTITQGQFEVCCPDVCTGCDSPSLVVDNPTCNLTWTTCTNGWTDVLYENGSPVASGGGPYSALTSTNYEVQWTKSGCVTKTDSLTTPADTVFINVGTLQQGNKFCTGQGVDLQWSLPYTATCTCDCSNLGSIGWRIDDDYGSNSVSGTRNFQCGSNTLIFDYVHGCDNVTDPTDRITLTLTGISTPASCTSSTINGNVNQTNDVQVLQTDVDNCAACTCSTNPTYSQGAGDVHWIESILITTCPSLGGTSYGVFSSNTNIPGSPVDDTELYLLSNLSGCAASILFDSRSIVNAFGMESSIATNIGLVPALSGVSLTFNGPSFTLTAPPNTVSQVSIVVGNHSADFPTCSEIIIANESPTTVNTPGCGC